MIIQDQDRGIIVQRERRREGGERSRRERERAKNRIYEREKRHTGIRIERGRRAGRGRSGDVLAAEHVRATDNLYPSDTTAIKDDTRRTHPPDFTRYRVRWRLQQLALVVQ